MYIILDRDGTIIKDKHYVHKIEDLEFLPKAIDGLKKMQSLGYQLIIVTNQAGIARGYFSEAQCQQFNDEMIKQLKASRVNILKSYFCPHHPEFTGECHCRKPKTGLAKKAAKEFNFKLSECIFIGDKDSDTKFGKNCKAKTILINNGQYPTSIKADFTIKNLEGAYKILSKP